MPDRTPTEVVLAFVEACNHGTVEETLAICDDEMVLEEARELPAAVSVHGLDELRRYLVGFGSHWSSAEWIPEEVRANGDRIYMRARLRLTGRRSGVEVDRVWRYVFTVRDGRLLRQDGFDDETEALAAAGLA